MPPNSRSPVRVVSIAEVNGASRLERQDFIVVEEPLAIRVAVNGSQAADFAVTMRTPGHDEELAAGLLLTEGIVRSREDVVRIHCPKDKNQVDVHLAAGTQFDPDRLRRNLYSSSSCGVCGKASIDTIQSSGCERLSDTTRVDAAVIHKLPPASREAQAAFERTGALHAATLFDLEGKLLCVREDVGRHNAVDKLLGGEFLGARPMQDRIVMLSGRIGFELVQKCAMARVPVVAAVGAPSSLAIETARRFNLTLLGFVRGGRFNLYTGAQRIV